MLKCGPAQQTMIETGLGFALSETLFYLRRMKHAIEEYAIIYTRCHMSIYNHFLKVEGPTGIPYCP